MAAKTQAQEEFDNIFAPLSRGPNYHPEDRHETDRHEDIDEETAFQQAKVDETMRKPIYDRGLSLRLPPPSFDSGRTTGVKGVIADARSFVQARREEAWKAKAAKENGRINGTTMVFSKQTKKDKRRDGERDGESYLSSDSEEDEEFLEQWREGRRKELMREGNDIRNRRTSPSMRRYGRFDEVDALGYLDAIERVGRDTVVVVFVYDHECPVSQVIESALINLVPANPLVHFVKVSYDEIEFDNAGVPAILAYKNQGDLFANLTYVIDQIPEDTIFDSQALKEVLQRNKIL